MSKKQEFETVIAEFGLTEIELRKDEDGVWYAYSAPLLHGFNDVIELRCWARRMTGSAA